MSHLNKILKSFENLMPELKTVVSGVSKELPDETKKRTTEVMETVFKAIKDRDSKEIEKAKNQFESLRKTLNKSK